jgi:hypothetical protein
MKNNCDQRGKEPVVVIMQFFLGKRWGEKGDGDGDGRKREDGGGAGGMGGAWCVVRDASQPEASSADCFWV